MTVRLREVGNSMTITIPKEIVRTLSLSQGSEVSIETQDDAIIVKPIKKDRRLTIRSLFEGYSDDYKPSEVDWGGL